MVKVEYTIEILREKQSTIGKETFTEHGLYLVLLSACHLGAIEVIKHFLNNHLNLFEINDRGV